MLTLSRALGPALAALAALVLGVTVVAAPSPARAATPVAASEPDFRCLMEPFGQTQSGRIVFRRVVDTRVTVSKTTRRPVEWRPISWALVSLNSVPGNETTRQLVASTDGVLRVVETTWSTRSGLGLKVLDVVGRRFPSRLVTLTGSTVYWVAEDRSLHRATWNGSRIVRRTTLPIVVDHARAMTAQVTNRGTRIYYTDRDGALHVVADRGRSRPTSCCGSRASPR